MLGIVADSLQEGAGTIKVASEVLTTHDGTAEIRQALEEIQGRLTVISEEMVGVERRAMRQNERIFNEIAALQRMIEQSHNTPSGAKDSMRVSSQPSSQQSEQMVAVFKEMVLLRGDLSSVNGRLTEFDREYRATMQSFREREEARAMQTESLLDAFRQMLTNQQQQQQQQHQPYHQSMPPPPPPPPQQQHQPQQQVQFVTYRSSTGLTPYSGGSGGSSNSNSGSSSNNNRDSPEPRSSSRTTTSSHYRSASQDRRRYSQNDR
jgi:dynactin complex subunit